MLSLTMCSSSHSKYGHMLCMPLHWRNSIPCQEGIGHELVDLITSEVIFLAEEREKLLALLHYY